METDGKKLMALEGLITRFAEGQFMSNGIPHELALVVMKGVYSNFQAYAIEHMIESQIKYNDDGTSSGEVGEND